LSTDVAGEGAEAGETANHPTGHEVELRVREEDLEGVAEEAAEAMQEAAEAMQAGTEVGEEEEEEAEASKTSR
jgi:hypothetical protein